MEEKRIYSLNLAAYIIVTTGLEPNYYADEVSGVYYCVFPQCEEVLEAIGSFRQSTVTVNLHQYLNEFKRLKEKIAALRG